jgi:hypothetical protein
MYYERKKRVRNVTAYTRVLSLSSIVHAFHSMEWIHGMNPWNGSMEWIHGMNPSKGNPGTIYYITYGLVT